MFDVSPFLKGRKLLEVSSLNRPEVSWCWGVVEHLSCKESSIYQIVASQPHHITGAQRPLPYPFFYVLTLICQKSLGRVSLSAVSPAWGATPGPPPSCDSPTLLTSPPTQITKRTEKVTWFSQVSTRPFALYVPRKIWHFVKKKPQNRSVICEITTCTSLHVSAAQSMVGEIDCNSKLERENMTR